MYDKYARRVIEGLVVFSIAIVSFALLAIVYNLVS